MDSSSQAAVFNDFAYVIPLQAWIYKTDGKWNFSKPVGRDGIHHYLLERGLGQTEARSLLKSQDYLRVFGSDMSPHRPAIYKDDTGSTFINLWVPPKLDPVPGDYPRIERILKWLCGGDEAGVEWLVHWLALKVQQPAIVPKVACVFSTEPGAGKGTLFRIIEEMLGKENCCNISRTSLESRFNSMWAQKLMVLADEVMSSENQEDVSDRLKILIDSPTIELEGKGKDQFSVKNRLAWVFASNDTITPVKVDRGDRRYTVFSNHDALTDDYRAMMLSCYEADRSRFTSDFVAEMQAFYHDLLHLDVDRAMVAFPYENEDRAALIEANRSAHEAFLREVDEHGIDRFLDELIDSGDWKLSSTRASWDFGDEGVATTAIYAAYVAYCKKTGARSLKLNKFGSAIRNHRPQWPGARRFIPGTTNRINCFIVKRTPKVNPTK